MKRVLLFTTIAFSISGCLYMYEQERDPATMMFAGEEFAVKHIFTGRAETPLFRTHRRHQREQAGRRH